MKIIFKKIMEFFLNILFTVFTFKTRRKVKLALSVLRKTQRRGMANLKSRFRKWGSLPSSRSTGKGINCKHFITKKNSCGKDLIETPPSPEGQGWRKFFPNRPKEEKRIRKEFVHLYSTTFRTYLLTQMKLVHRSQVNITSPKAKSV